MERVEKSVEVDCPVRAVYDQWTQFEEFPQFMAGVKEVKQVDESHVHWHAEIWGKDKEWDAEITEQVPDSVISWRSVSGDAPNAGTVRFEPLSSDRTRVRLAMEYEPQGATEKTGDALGVMSARVSHTMSQFKKYIERRGAPPAGWRGEIRDGEQRSGAGSESRRLAHRDDGQRIGRRRVAGNRVTRDAWTGSFLELKPDRRGEPACGAPRALRRATSRRTARVP